MAPSSRPTSTATHSCGIRSNDSERWRDVAELLNSSERTGLCDCSGVERLLESGDVTIALGDHRSPVAGREDKRDSARKKSVCHREGRHSAQIDVDHRKVDPVRLCKQRQRSFGRRRRADDGCAPSLAVGPAIGRSHIRPQPAEYGAWSDRGRSSPRSGLLRVEAGATAAGRHEIDGSLQPCLAGLAVPVFRRTLPISGHSAQSGLWLLNKSSPEISSHAAIEKADLASLPSQSRATPLLHRRANDGCAASPARFVRSRAAT
jgi:hypothetical protein